jgi:hypothetical protein
VGPYASGTAVFVSVIVLSTSSQSRRMADQSAAGRKGIHGTLETNIEMPNVAWAEPGRLLAAGLKCALVTLLPRSAGRRTHALLEKPGIATRSVKRRRRGPNGNRPIGAALRARN